MKQILLVIVTFNISIDQKPFSNNLFPENKSIFIISNLLHLKNILFYYRFNKINDIYASL